MSHADLFAATGLVLGEGPIATSAGFACVDIRSGSIVDGSVDGSIERIEQVDGTVGAIAETRCGRRVAAVGQSICLLGDDRHVTLTGLPSDIRFNDGTPDPAGRFLCGTMADPPRGAAGSLYAFEGGTPRIVVGDVTISNGLASSADGSTLFYVDTPTHRIDAFDYDVESGTVENRRTVVRIDPDLGVPDGMTIDADGGLWVALWGGSAVHRYHDGTLTDVVSVPTSFPTCPAFIGRDLDTLLITTASEPTPDDPAAGHLYATRPGVVGAAPTLVDVEFTFESE